MKGRMIITGLCIMLAFSITACGTKGDTAKTASAENNSTNAESIENKKENDNSKEASTEETTVIEVSEEASSTAKEDGTIIVTTESGEKILVKPTDKQEKNADGSVTYTTEDGQKVTVNESTGNATVTSEVEVPTSSETAPSSETPSGSSGSSETPTEHKHSYTVTVTKQPTCTEGGEKTYTCSCGHQYTDVISKTGHNAGGWEVKENATCKKEGTEVRKCTSCGKEMETRAIAKTGHTSSDWIVTKEATETAEGTKVKKCTVCDTILETASIAKVAHNHSYTWTYVSNGDYKVNKCSCGQKTGERAYNLGNGVYGQWKDSMADDLMYWTNMQRGNTGTTPVDGTGNYLPSVISQPLSNTLSSQAKARALQCVFDYGHNGMITTDECLAQGYSDAGSVSSEWMASGDHGPAMCDYRYTQGGTACLWYDSDGNGTMTYIWVLVQHGLQHSKKCNRGCKKEKADR